MEDNEIMTAERSLEIISRAIEQGRRDVERNAGTPMIVWGVQTAAIGVIIFALWTLTGKPSWNLLWFAMCAVGWGVYGYMKKRRSTSDRPTSYAWKLVSWVWTVFGILAVGTAVIGAFSYDTSVYGSRLPITAVMILPGYIRAKFAKMTLPPIKAPYALSFITYAVTAEANISSSIITAVMGRREP